MYWYILISTLAGLLGIGVYLYYLRKGQFEDPEDVKYQMFRDAKQEEKEKERR